MSTAMKPTSAPPDTSAEPKLELVPAPTLAGPAPSPAPPSDWAANLWQRVLTAAVAVPVVLAVVWFGGWVAFAAALFILAVGIGELRALCARRGWRPVVVLSGGISLVFFVSAVLPLDRLLVLQIGISALVVGAFVWLALTRSPVQRTLVDWALTLAIPFYLGWGLMFLLLIRGTQSGPDARGFWWLLVLLFGVWACDSAALLVGHAVGRRPLAPQLSPHKTWEGAIGGLVATALVVPLVVMLANAVLPAASRLPVPLYQAVLLGVLIAGAGTFGDLAKSLIKRAVGVKDSGGIFPGHGGMLDRIDSALFAGYVVYFYALALGALH